MRSHVNLLGLLQLTWGGSGLLLAIGGWANAWAGRALRRHLAPGRTVSLVLAVVNLFVLPFGTALAIYTFWVLLHNDARALFVNNGTTAH